MMLTISSDWRISRANLYVVQQGGTLIPILPSDVPGSIPHASSVMAQIRALPEVRAALGVVTWSFERETENRRNREEPSELVTSMGVDGDPTLIPGALAACPEPSAATGGDPRSNGQGPGLVGTPFIAILVVIAIGVAATVVTTIYVRLTKPEKSPPSRLSMAAEPSKRRLGLSSYWQEV